MPRIPDTEIDRIKRETDLAALVRSRGVELKKHGTGNLIGTCPFHEDKDPSFIVTPAKGLFHCMGCGVAGNAIQFVEKFDGVSFRHAFEILNAGPAAFTPPADAPLKKATVPRLDLPFDPDANDATLMRQVVDYYHERLLTTPAALDYLRGRGLYSEEAVDRFRLGFADRTLCLRLPEKNRKDGAAIRTRLQSLGLLREGKGGKDRVVPVGERALSWLTRYLEHARPMLETAASERALFLTGYGERFSAMYLGNWVRRVIEAAGIGRSGSCHLFRHSCATHMLENGADIRFIQQMLGHARLDTTQIYTEVGIVQLREVHARTHPHAHLQTANKDPK